MPQPSPLLLLCLLASPAASQNAPPPIQVYVLAGQSNMEGKAKVSLLEYQATQEATRARFAHLRKDHAWVVRDDVWIRFLDRHGPLTVGYGSPGRIGLELDFGFTLGDRTEAPVLLIKTAWGGRSLYTDFCPPSAGPPDADVFARLLEGWRRRQPELDRKSALRRFGHDYRQMIALVQDTLDHLDRYVPGHADRGAELAGFVWFQGWNDMIDPDFTAAYATNMEHFIRDVRRDLKAPTLPFVIAQFGVGGVLEEDRDAKRHAFKQAQAEAAADPDFAGNVQLVPTDVYWDTRAQAVFDRGWKENLEAWNRVGSDYPFHYLGSPRSYCDIGRACAEALWELAAKDRQRDAPTP